MEKDRTISLQAAIDAVNSGRVKEDGMHLWRCERNETLDAVVELLEAIAIRTARNHGGASNRTSAINWMDAET